MSFPLSRVLLLSIVCTSFGTIALFADGCSSDSTSPSGTEDDAAASGDGTTKPKDGGVITDDDASTDSGGGTDSGTDTGTTGKGETCIGFGTGTPCGANGNPDYGYVCFNGSPPGFTGCKQASSSAFGETYCCPDNKCVAQPDQDKECKAAGTPHRYQCPPDGMGGSVAPPAGCADGGSGGSAVERFYCCP